jgi:putative DNA primase/helicase
VHPNGAIYHWIDDCDPRLGIPVAPAPEWLLDMLAPPLAPHADAYVRAALAGELERVRAAPVGTRNNTLNSAAFNLGQVVEGRDTDDIKASLLRAAIACGLPEREARATIESGLKAGALHPRPIREARGKPDGLENRKRDQDAAQEADRPVGHSDDDLALRFTERHSDDARFVAAWNRWLWFDGTRWCEESTLRAFSEARAVCRDAAAACSSRHAADKIKSAATIAAVERLARADRRHAATTDEWDADPWLLNTPSGTVDLRTGKLRPAQRSDRITKSTAVAPAGECPLWRSFLRRIFAHDEELTGFVQRALGYSLTGVTTEHSLFFAYGTGGNGKGTLMNTVTGILGDHVAVASMETFTASYSDRHPTELAMLRGARLVASQETERGRRWAESRIKALTGGDPISARFMRQDFFTFTPQFKLWVAGNHKPALGLVDEAIRRRFNLIPFATTIPEAERDPDLPEKLKSEWPGILAWMIAGCLDWQRTGLATPTAITSATAEYLADEDVFGTWVDEMIRPAHENATEPSADLFAAWKRDAERAGEPPGDKKALTQALKDRGFTPCRIGHTRARGFQGIRLVRPALQNTDQ